MAIHISVVARTPNEAVLTVTGRLSQDAVPLLDGELSRILVDAQRVVLDLKHVRFIDNHGLASLRRWTLARPAHARQPQVRLSVRDGSRFVRLRLASRGLAVD